MIEPTNAPCGHPISLFDHTDGAQRPILLLAGGWDGVSRPAIWCGECLGWIGLQPADHAALVLAERASVPTEPADLSALLAVTESATDRVKLFGLLQRKVGKGAVNRIWYAAGDLERVLLAGRTLS